MNQIRKRLTYANVMSSIAVFLVIGGATAFAALSKNSVGSKQLKKNAVTTNKIKKEAVTGAKIKNGAVTGAKVNLSSIGTVPSATNATNAQNADNAKAVGGNTVRKFFYSSNETNAKTTILSLNGLTLTASCEGGAPQGIATTSVDDSLIHSGGTFGGGEFYTEDDDFEIGDEFDFLDDAVTFGDSVEGTFTYAQPGGGVITAVFASEEGAFNEFNTDCLISGHVISG